MNFPKPPAGNKIPDLYGLLNLPAREHDTQVIQLALREYALKIKQMKSADASQQAVKLYAIAKHNLLDPGRKAAYDVLYDKVLANKEKHAVINDHASGGSSSPATAGKSPSLGQQPGVLEPQWDLTELGKLLPPGDAGAPLDLAAFLDLDDSLDGQQIAENLDRDFQRLMQLLSGEVVQATTVGTVNSGSHNTAPCEPAQPVIPAAILDSTPKNGAGGTRANLATASVNQRKYRDRNLLWMMSGSLLVLLTVLGGLVLLLNRNPHDQTSNPIVATKDSQTIQAGKSTKGSGLPQPGDALEQPPAVPPVSNLPQLSEVPQTDHPMVIGVAAPEKDNSLPAADVVAQPPASSNSAQLSDAPPIVSDGATTVPPMTATEQMVSLTDAEKKHWTQQLREARQLMGKRDMANARRLLEQATSIAKSSQQRAQLTRLNTLLPLVERVQQAMAAAVIEMKGGEVFKAGTQEISFVEANEEQLVVKIRGPSNSRYKWDEIPIILAYGLADLKLESSPSSEAAKAAFAAVHGRINSTAKEQARKVLQTAATSNVVPADTHEVFDDDYSLE